MCICINVKVVDKYVFFRKLVFLLCAGTLSVIEVYNIFVSPDPNAKIPIYNDIN